MSDAWIELEESGRTRRVPLRGTTCVIGPEGSDVPLSAAPSGRLRLTLAPPALRHEGPEEPPRRLARSFADGPLAEGDVLEWCGARFSVHGLGSSASLREGGGARPERAAAGAEASEAEAFQRLGRRIAAGVAAEIALAPREATRELQSQAARGSFEPDPAAERLLEGVSPTDPRLAARVATLERDLLLAPLQRGGRAAARRAREVVRGGLAGLVAQALVLLAMSALLFAVLVLARARWDFSLDLWLDRVLGRA